MTSTGSSSDIGDGFLTTGRFSALTLLSVKALRLYDERDLLAPRWVDPVNGYRYYAPDQVSAGWLVALLRSADLSLSDIAQIIGAERDAAVDHLDRCDQALASRSHAIQAVLARARLHLTQELPVPDIISVLEIDRPVLSVLRRMNAHEMDTVVPEHLERLRDLATANGLAITGAPFGIFHAPVTDDSDGPLEIALPVDGLADVEADVRSYRLPGGLMAQRYAEGEQTWFPQILTLYDDVHRWTTTSGRVPVGPPRETWHNSPHGPGPLRLTISWPYASQPDTPGPRTEP